MPSFSTVSKAMKLWKFAIKRYVKLQNGTDVRRIKAFSKVPCWCVFFRKLLVILIVARGYFQNHWKDRTSNSIYLIIWHSQPFPLIVARSLSIILADVILCRMVLTFARSVFAHLDSPGAHFSHSVCNREGTKYRVYEHPSQVLDIHLCSISHIFR